MSAEAVFSLCVLALIQSTLGQCIPFECGCDNFMPVASTGGNFVVTSSSPVAPIGISVVSDNLYEGALIVEGNLPLLGSVALEGTMGTAGAGAVSYGCGDDVGIVAEEGPISTGIVDDNLGCSNVYYGNFGEFYKRFMNNIYGRRGCGCGYSYL